MNKMLCEAVHSCGDTVRLRYSDGNWDGLATILAMEDHGVELYMLTGNYAGGVGTFRYEWGDEWEITPARLAMLRPLLERFGGHR